MLLNILDFIEWCLSNEHIHLTNMLMLKFRAVLSILIFFFKNKDSVSKKPDLDVSI